MGSPSRRPLNAADPTLRVRMNCPHCGDRSYIRDSKEMGRYMRKLTFACRNTQCGHVFQADLTATCTLSPSAIPDPDVSLPLSPHIRAEVLRRQLDMFNADDKESAA